jgi:hypothetical protein
MTTNHNHAASPSSKIEGIPFSLTLPPQALDGTIMISPQVDDPATFVIEFQHAGVRLGSAALTEDGALDLALRLVGAVMQRRRAGVVQRIDVGGPC